MISSCVSGTVVGSGNIKGNKTGEALPSGSLQSRGGWRPQTHKQVNTISGIKSVKKKIKSDIGIMTDWSRRAVLDTVVRKELFGEPIFELKLNGVEERPW